MIDADLVAHETYAPGTEGFYEVVAGFGESVLTAAGQVDRRRLAEIVFDDRAALERLEDIVHPRARAAVAGKLNSMRERRVEAAVLVAPLLKEAGWTDRLDRLIARSETAQRSALDVSLRDLFGAGGTGGPSESAKPEGPG